MEAKEIIDFTEIVSRIKEIDNLIDEYLTEYKDYKDTASEIISPIKSVLSIWTLAKRLKFKSFLKHYAKQVDQKAVELDEIISQLKQYLSNAKNVEFIAESIDSAINSKSVLCSGILGYYTGMILLDTKKLEYKDFIVINALKIMVDDDVKNLVKLYIFLNKSEQEYRIYDLINESAFKVLGLDSIEIELTIEKLKSVQAIGYAMGGLGDFGNAWGAFKFNQNTHYLYKIIQNSKILIE